ncbi:hypothetical protein CHS0354_005262 [Potamilus streckersoni]|uniref:Uncharacterized protein n=1 Tax=Potamilus streckersoni TaxID=2493646 RepID=A0AAE0VNT2_9BIVA|nr:hypothetical protein CHS0354_005262 [Potamilus streckersoni]
MTARTVKELHLSDTSMSNSFKTIGADGMRWTWEDRNDLDDNILSLWKPLLQTAQVTIEAEHEHHAVQGCNESIIYVISNNPVHVLVDHEHHIVDSEWQFHYQEHRINKQDHCVNLPISLRSVSKTPAGSTVIF